MQTDVKTNIKEISDRIIKCCTKADINSSGISLVAVSKKKSQKRAGLQVAPAAGVEQNKS